MAGVKFINGTDEFRKAANAAHLFYVMDGHFNPAGHQVFAELLTPRLLQQWHDGK
jgi:lysophospholipase L1-like esterase